MSGEGPYSTGEFPPELFRALGTAYRCQPRWDVPSEYKVLARPAHTNTSSYSLAEPPFNPIRPISSKPFTRQTSISPARPMGVSKVHQQARSSILQNTIRLNALRSSSSVPSASSTPNQMTPFTANHAQATPRYSQPVQEPGSSTPEIMKAWRAEWVDDKSEDLNLLLQEPVTIDATAHEVSASKVLLDWEHFGWDMHTPAGAKSQA